MPELGKQIQGERDLSSNNRIIRISAGSNNRESIVIRFDRIDEYIGGLGGETMVCADGKIF